MTCAKTIITTGRDCGTASWIKIVIIQGREIYNVK